MDCFLGSWQAVVLAPLVGTLASPVIAAAKSITALVEEATDLPFRPPGCCYACLLATTGN